MPALLGAECLALPGSLAFPSYHYLLAWNVPTLGPTCPLRHPHRRPAPDPGHTGSCPFKTLELDLLPSQLLGRFPPHVPKDHKLLAGKGHVTVTVQHNACT